MIYYELPGIFGGNVLGRLGTFNYSLGNALVYSIIIDGSYLYASGAFDSYTDSFGTTTTRQFIAEINLTTGLIDPTFNTASGPNDAIFQMILNSNNLYIIGNFTSYKGTTRQYIAKINATDASLDATFDTTSGASATIRSMALDNINNALYIGGNFTSYKGTTRQYIAKINATDASLDATFDTTSGANNAVFNLLLVGSNLYITGFFTSYKGTTRQYIAKINATDASLDTTFNTASGLDNNGKYLLFNNNNLYVAGNFTSYKGTTRQYIAKINATDASLDTTFNTASGPNATIESMVLNSNSLYIAGFFTSYKGTTRQYVVKINATDASLDATFDTASGANNAVFNLLLVGSNLYIVGGFTTYKSTSRGRIAKVNATTAADET